MGLEALRIKNLRCLSDTGKVPIRPITVLVGRNSSGKSTFLRAFPLLRQSVETARESPILWYHRQYVDFGSIQDAINDRAVERSVTFEFSVRLPESAGVSIGELVFDVAMTLGEEPLTHSVYIRSYELQCEGGPKASLTFDPGGRLETFLVGDRDFAQIEPFSLGGTAFLVPTILPRGAGRVTYRPIVGLAQIKFQPYQSDAPDYLRTQLAIDLAPLWNDLSELDEGIATGSSLRVGSCDAMLTQLRSIDGGQIFNKKVASIEKNDFRFNLITKSVIATLAPYILEAVDRQLADYAARVSYLAPIRATAERSYRMQDLSVSEVDPRGENLAMFLRSLSEQEAQDFAAFTREHLGFESKIRILGMHAEILVRESGSSRHINLVDIGFGYSQVLPLMAILWSTCCRPPRVGNYATSLLAIEQPELHLHPAHQVKLAGMLASAMLESRKAGREVKIMVETHSEGLVNGLGELIHKKIISASDVQIVLFDQDDETRQTTVRLAGYEEDGALNDAWPFGFFAPVADD